MIFQFILHLIIKSQHILPGHANETIGTSCSENLGSGIGSGPVLTSGVWVAKYPTEHSLNTNKNKKSPPPIEMIEDS